MAYSTEALVRAASGFSNTANITSATITAYLDDADSVINGYIGDVYSLPLSTTCEMIETIARHITVGLLYANEYGEESQGTDKGWKGRLDWAMDLLKQIQDQKLKLRGSTGTELTRSSFRLPVFSPTTAESDASATDTKEPRFTMNTQY